MLTSLCLIQEFLIFVISTRDDIIFGICFKIIWKEANSGNIDETKLAMSEWLLKLTVA